MTTTISSSTNLLREKMLESQQIDFLIELGADSSYVFDLDDFCRTAEKKYATDAEEKAHRE